MLDRESTFADPEIVELLKTRFVPVALDQWYTRRQQDTEGDFYRQIAGQGPRNNFSQTTQGLYIADPAGQLIAYNNNRGPERIRALMQRAVADYAPPDATPLEETKVDPRFHPELPEGTRIVRSAAIVLGGYEETEDPWQKIFQRAVSRDNLWILSEELDVLSKEGIFPDSLARRIARFHLTDSTRGQPTSWERNEIRSLQIELSDGKITGSVRLQSGDGTRGYEAQLQGQIEFGPSGELTHFDLLVEGEYFGTGQYTMKAPEGRFPVRIAFQLADGTDSADFIPPHASRGWIDGYLDPDR